MIDSYHSCWCRVYFDYFLLLHVKSNNCVNYMNFLAGRVVDGREMAVQFAKYGPNAERMWVTGSFCKYIKRLLQIFYCAYSTWGFDELHGSLSSLLYYLKEFSSGIIQYVCSLMTCLWAFFLSSDLMPCLVSVSKGGSLRRFQESKEAREAEALVEGHPFQLYLPCCFLTYCVFVIYLLYRYLPCYWSFTWCCCLHGDHLFQLLLTQSFPVSMTSVVMPDLLGQLKILCWSGTP